MTAAYNKTSLQPSRRSLVVDRDYLAHVLKWSFAVRVVEDRDHAVARPFAVLDVGCGVEAPLAAVVCSHAYLARGRRLQYVGVDVGPITPLATPSWATYLAHTDALTWSPPEPADLVVCLEVIEHMDRSDGLVLLSRLRDFVRPDGVVLLATPVRARTLPRNHLYEWGLDELLGAARAAHLEPAAVYGTFMDVDAAARLVRQDSALHAVWTRLSAYYSREVLSCLFTPLFPTFAKSVLLVLRPDPTSARLSSNSAKPAVASRPVSVRRTSASES